MNITWEPTEGYDYQAQYGTDEAGNYYRISANKETVSVSTPDGFNGSGWTAEEALATAILERPTILTAPYNLTADDLGYWTDRAGTVTDKTVFIKRATPITFNRSDWSGSIGTIFPVGPDTFEIENIDDQWLMEKCEDDKNVIVMTNTKDGRKYYGVKCNKDWLFSEAGCQRENEDPRIAFAQMMYNI